MAIREATVVDWPARSAELEARQGTLDADGWDEWGQALWFLGREDACEHAWARAHEEYLSAVTSRVSAPATFMTIRLRK